MLKVWYLLLLGYSQVAALETPYQVSSSSWILVRKCGNFGVYREEAAEFAAAKEEKKKKNAVSRRSFYSFDLYS